MRRVAAVLALALLAAPLAAEAQAPAKVARIGFLSGHYLPAGLSIGPFSDSLRELGYRDYRDFVMQSRQAAGDDTLLPRLAAELVQLNVDVIVADTTTAALAAKSATKTIPIVAIAGDAVGSGLVASLARPSENITGLSTLSPELGAKRLQLLKEAVPRVSRVAVLWTPAHTAEAVGLQEMQAAARALGLKLAPLGARRPPEYDEALAEAVQQGANALVVFGGDPFAGPAEGRIVSLVAKRRLPAIYDRREYAEAGGLMAFGVSLPAVARRAAVFVDKILKGAKPADLPVEQPTKFELVINMKTAKALGLTIPPSVLVRADQIIE